MAEQARLAFACPSAFPKGPPEGVTGHPQLPHRVLPSYTPDLSAFLDAPSSEAANDLVAVERGEKVLVHAIFGEFQLIDKCIDVDVSHKVFGSFT